MLEGPLGGAAFNNEFGRPALTGCSVPTNKPSATIMVRNARVLAYHVAGGMRYIRNCHVQKGDIQWVRS